MPIESTANNSSETTKSSEGWLAKCGLLIPSLSVREKRGSGEDPSRLVMSPANYKDKKRKRSLGNLKSRLSKKESKPNLQDAQIPTAQVQELKMSSDNITNVAMFDEVLDNNTLHDDHERERRSLLEAEAAKSWDCLAKKSASKTEIKAGKIVRELREFERKVVFGNLASEAIPGPETLDMGGQFLTNKARIESKSKLYEIAKKAPKGALLHLHFNAELHPERLLEEARGMKTMYIRSTEPLHKRVQLDVTEMVFNVMPEDTPSNDIFTETYKGNGKDFKKPEMTALQWMRWSEFCEKFPYAKDFTTSTVVTENGSIPNSSEQGPVNLGPAENWLIEKMVLSEKEAYDPAQTVNGVWARFNQATRCFKGLINYEQVYKWYIGQAIDRMIDEKVMYAELRPMLLDKSIPTNDGKGTLDLSTQMKMILECVNAKKKELKMQGRLDQFPFGLKIIYCTPRSIPKALMRKEIKDCIRLKEEFPELICGFDLVGAEDRPNNIGFYSDELAALEKVCKEKGLDIPFLFHAGETLLDTGGSDDPEKSNLYDAVLFKAKRIGHGFSLLKHPHLIEHFKKTDEQPGICIELCPISNELLHLCRNIKEHPFAELLAAGIPCTVNSDNPSLFRNSMSHEFYQVMVGAPTITIHSWKQLAQWSLDYSCLADVDKRKAHQIFKKDWAVFCDEVVKKYGHILQDDVDKDAELRNIYHMNNEKH